MGRFLALFVLTSNLALAAADFDQKLAAQFSADYLIYVAVKDVRAKGPLMDRPLTDQTMPNPAAAALKDSLKEFQDEAIKRGLVKKDIREIMEKPLCMGMKAPPAEKADPAMLMITESTPKLASFLTLVKETHLKRAGSKAVEDVDVGEPTKAMKLSQDEANPMIVFSGKEFFYVGSTPEVIKEALARAKKKVPGLVETTAYKRAHTRIQADSVGFMVISPRELITSVERVESDPKKKEEIKDFITNLDAMESLLFQLKASEKQSEIGINVLFNAKSPQFAKIQGFFPARGITSQTVIPGTSTLFLGFLRPANILEAAGESRVKLEEQFKSLQGMLQMQAGLQYDEDLAPWWGRELSFAMLWGDQAPSPQMALLIESTKDDLAQKAIDKVVNHLTYTKNQAFKDLPMGRIMVKTSSQPIPNGGGQPSFALLPGYAVVATGTQIINEIVSSRDKMASSPIFKQVARTINPKTMAFGFYASATILDRILALKPPVPEGQPDPQGDALKKMSQDLHSVLFGVGMAESDILNISILFNGK